MPMHPAVLRRRSVLTAALALAAPAVRAQQPAPARAVRLLVGYGAGGAVDTAARLLAARLPARIGVPVQVENRAGGSGALAADLVARAPADGTSLLMGETGMLAAPHLGARLGFEPLRSFVPVAGAFRVPLLVVANHAIKAATPREFIALLKANPGRYSYASPGVGTVHHLGMELLKARTGAFIVHIPYRGASQIVPDVVSGQVPFGVVSASSALAQVRAGRLRAIAMMSTGKLPGAESVPPLADALPGFDVGPRLFVLAPAGTPAALVERWSEAVRAVLASPDMVQATGQAGVLTAYLPPPALATDMAAESAAWAQVIRQQHVKLE